MSKTIRLFYVAFIICAQAITSQAGSYLCSELERCKEEASLSSKNVSRDVEYSIKEYLGTSLMRNVKWKSSYFKIEVEEERIKGISHNKSTFLASAFALSLLILFVNPRLTIPRISFNILILFFISKYGATNPPSQTPPTCIGCPSCILTTTCTYLCPYGYYFSSGICYFFTNMPGCTVVNGVSCVSCNSSYYLSVSSNCILCSQSIPNCQTCSNSSICSQCISGYTVNFTSGTCDSCSLIIPFCTTCFNRNVCTNCINQTYFINQNFKCQLCIKRNLGCFRCISTTCYQCFPGYALVNNTCFECSKIIGCWTCLNFIYCTACISTAYIFAGNTCIPCVSIFPLCQNCTATVCTACESSFFLNTNFQCQCKRGSLIDDQCIDVAGCNAAIKYKNKSYCTQCDQNIFKFNTSTLICDCRNGFLLNYQCTFLYGCIAMIMVNNNQTCVMCNKSRHFTVNNGECFCDYGYFFQKGDNNCYQTCGDGILFYLQCDDGNLIDGDGCTSKCTIEDNFICSGGSQTTASHCVNKLQNFQLEMQEIENVGGYNIAKFQFRINNYIQFLHTLNYSTIFSLEIKQKHNVNSISITSNKVTFMVEYFEDLEGFPAVLHLNLDPEYFLYKKVISLPFVMVSQTAPLVLTEYPSQLILDILSKVLFALSIVSLLLLHFAPCVHKMIALETITVLQLCNLAPFLIPGDSLTIRVFSNLSLSNGFGRQFFTNPINSETYGTTFQHISLAKNFTQNMLINESFLIFVVVIFFILYFLKEKMDKKQTKKKIRKNIYQFVYVYFWNLVFSVSMALFLFSLIALNCNNHRVYEKTYNGRSYESTQKYKIVNSTVNLLSIFIVFPFIASLGFINIFAFFAQKNALKQYSSSKIIKLIYREIERLNVKNKVYVSMFVINLFASFTFLSSFFFLDLEYKVFIYFLVSLPFALIVIIYRPYNKLIDNFGICLGQFTSITFILGLCIKQYFRIVKASLCLKYEFYFCIGIVFLLTILVIVSINRCFVTWFWYLNRNEQMNKAKKLKQSDDRKMSYERVEMHLEAQTKKECFFKRLKFQEITATVDNPDIQRIKDKLRGNLLEKRNLQRNLRTLSDPFDPIQQAFI